METTRTKRPREESEDSVETSSLKDTTSETLTNNAEPKFDDDANDFLSFASAVDTENESDNLPPWATGVWDPQVPPLVSLHNEILQFCDLISLSKDEQRARDMAVSDIKKVLARLWPNCQVKLFGSELTGLCLPSSDLDIACLNVSMEKVNGLSPLRVFANELRSAGLVSQLEVVESAKVPIVKLVHALTQVAADVSFNVNDGLETGWFMRKQIEAMPQLRPLLLVVKYFLCQRGLNETYPSGGIGSFLLQLMTLSFLQHKSKMQKSAAGGAEFNLGSLLVEFFDLYGRKLNYDVVGLSVRHKGSYFKKRDRHFKNGQIRPGLLCAENPLMPDLDVGRNAFNIATSKRAMVHAHMVLLEALSAQLKHSHHQAQQHSSSPSLSTSSSSLSAHSFTHPPSSSELAAELSPPPSSALAAIIFADLMLKERSLPSSSGNEGRFTSALPPPPQDETDSEEDEDERSQVKKKKNKKKKEKASKVAKEKKLKKRLKKADERRTARGEEPKPTFTIVLNKTTKNYD